LYIETVHRLSSLGAVFTQAAHGITSEGFDAEWRGVDILTVDGDLIDRCERFDEADIDAAIATFDQLSRPTRRLQNTAAQLNERTQAYFIAGDWDAVAGMLADDYYIDDRRHVVNDVLRQGRDVAIANLRATADLGVELMTSDVIATRGGRLALSRTQWSGRDEGPNAFRTEALAIVEINADNQMAATVLFDLDDIDTAFADLDARYLAGEAAAHAHTWTAIARTYAGFNRGELPTTTDDWVIVDHRHLTTIVADDHIASVRAWWELAPDLSIYIEAVHRLSDIGAVFTWAGHGTSQEGFAAEWRGINVLTAEGDLINRSEMFDEADTDAALARFEELSRPASRLENTASRVFDSFRAYFAARDWTAIAGTLAEDMCNDDRRRVVGAEILHGRSTDIAHMRAIADVGAKTIASTIIATRGERLVLSSIRFSGEDQRPDAFHTQLLGIVEIDADEQIVARLSFDPEDINAAFEELDARYLAGAAAAHAHAWSVIAGVYAGFNRHERPATTPDFVIADHRPLITIGADALAASIHAVWELTPDISIYMETVHRLNDLGAVVTHAAYGTSPEGFGAEWRMIDIFTIEGDLVSRCEMFDEADIDAALARFDELSRPPRRLENAACQVAERFLAHFAVHDWDAMAKILADDIRNDDRRRLLGAGVRRGRDAEIENMRTAAEVGTISVTSTVIATRGERLALRRLRFSVEDPAPEAFVMDLLGIVEIDADDKIVANIGFDVDDIDAAFAELDARYLTGEAADHAHTWSAVAAAYAAFNRRELPATTPDWINIDHRRGAAFARGDVIPYIRAAWEVAPDISIYIEAVHRLSDLGAVVIYAANGTSAEGFNAEWREITLLTFEGDRISRCEIFDEADIDAAVARFDELSRPARRLENAAGQVTQRFWIHFAARDWAALAETLADDHYSDDRRRVVGSGVRPGREALIADMQAIADLGTDNITSTVIATRGARLALSRIRSSAFETEVLSITEVATDERIAAFVTFDFDDVDAAFEELDALYLAGESAAHSRTWSAIASGYAALSRHEVPPTTPDFVNIDHRRGIAFEPGDMIQYIRATFDVAPDVNIHIVYVHRLSSLGAVVTHAAHGTSPEGFGAEWREIALLTVDGDAVNRCEMFDEADLDAALARFDELSRQAPRLQNAASRMYDRFNAYLAARDWDAMAEMMTDDVCNDDRRRVVSAGIRRGRDAQIANLRAVVDVGVKKYESIVIATRGERVALTRSRVSGGGQPAEAFALEMLTVIEIDTDNRIAAGVNFDLDDIDAAFDELDARYLAGEAATHARTWSLIAKGYAAINRREVPSITGQVIDKRRLAPIEGVDLTAYIAATLDLTRDITVYIEAVHRLTDRAAVVTHVARATSQDGVDAEWRVVDVYRIEGDRIDRCEMFDDSDLDTALARFEELNSPAPQFENAATRIWTPLADAFNRHDWNGVLALVTADGRIDDRRQGLRALHEGSERLKAGRTLLETMPESWLMEIDPLAIRGSRLSLIRQTYRDTDEADWPVTMEALTLTEISDDGLVRDIVLFDPDDINGAIGELTTRWIASEEVAHPEVIDSVCRLNETANRHEWDAIAAHIAGATYVNHRQLAMGGDETVADYLSSIKMLASLVPDLRSELAEVLAHSARGLVHHTVLKGTSTDGMPVEISIVQITLLEGDRVTHIEAFDPDQRDLALARFAELNHQA
jgi:hypothetical protein